MTAYRSSHMSQSVVTTQHGEAHGMFITGEIGWMSRELLVSHAIKERQQWAFFLLYALLHSTN